MMYMCIHTMYIMYIVYAVCSFMYGPCICTRFDRSRLCLYRRQEDGDYRCEDANGGREDKGRREDEEDLEDLPGNGHACMPRGVGWGGGGGGGADQHGGICMGCMSIGCQFGFSSALEARALVRLLQLRALSSCEYGSGRTRRSIFAMP